MKTENRPPQTRYYCLGAMERAIVRISELVRRPNSCQFSTVQLTPTEWAMLLEAARLGAAQIYEHPEFLQRMGEYPFP